MERLQEVLQQMKASEGTASPMPQYRCHKEVWALKIAEILDPTQPGPGKDGNRIIVPADPGYAPFLVNYDYMRKHKPEVGGYYVVYKDGYKSFSPAAAFEEGYAKLNTTLGSIPDGVMLIAAERKRQIEKEGWSADHDDEHDGGEMAIAAACYAANEHIFTLREHESRNQREFKFRDPWPWSEHWDKRPTTRPSMPERLRMLEKAGALIAAEIDRLQRVVRRSAIFGGKQGE